ncbi:MAG: hypothetical protein HC882_06285 [Acidobacteria bacterium]|nr:hypothetical protein [Acidobacteriota bacterium]
MATAQILLVVKAPGDIEPSVFQTLVEGAARAAGASPSAWTYDATPVLLERDVDSALVQTVKGGPWNGLQFTSGSALPPGQSSAVVSAYRQNIVGVTPGRENSVGTQINERVGEALRARGEVRSGLKYLRHPISWDRGIPAAISLGTGGSSAGGVAAAAGIFGLLTLAAIYGTRR